MLIAQIIRDKGPAVHAVKSGATLEEAAQELDARKVGALVVLDEDASVIGVLSERDIVREIARRGASCLGDAVSTAMTRTVITCALEESVDQGLARMTGRRVRHLPVLDEGRLAGIVSIGDLVKHRIAAVEAEAAAMQAYIAAH